MNAPRTPPSHDALVARLKADLTPVRPLWSPTARLLSWGVLAGLVVGIARGATLRPEFAVAPGGTLQVLEIATLLGAAIAAASAAFLGAVPGRADRRLAWLAIALAFASAVILLAEPVPAGPAAGPFVERGLRCTFWVTTFGLLPWLAILAAVRRGAPLEARATGAAAGAAAFVVGAAAARIACPIDDPVHVLVWHLGTIVPWTVLSAILGAVWLARWRRPTGP